LANQQYAPPAVPFQKWNDTVVMDLAQSEAALWRSLAPTCRNKVRKAKRAGVRLVMDEACGQLESFHALYSATMNRLEAAPYYLFPLHWFKSLIDLLPNHAVLANAVVGDDLIASSVFLFCGRHMHYFLSGSDAERHSLCPNNLLLYEAALWGKRRGYTRLHLGGGQLPNDSLFQFKSSFSPLGAPFFIGKKVHDASTYAMLLDRQDAGIVRELLNLHPFPGYRASRQQFQTAGVSGMNDTIIIGASGHARVCLDVLLAQGYHIKGFYDDNPYLSNSSIHGYPVLGNIGTLLDAQETTAFDYFVAIGNNEHRQSIMTRLSERYGRVALNAIHPSAVISSRSRIGHGNFIAQGVIVNTDTVIGNGVIINTGATVDHDNLLHDFAQISPGCNLAGNVEVGQGAFLGIGAVVIPGKTIGAFAVVGAGAVVTGNLPAHCTAVGVPARVIRQRSKIEK
jgi:sugar O-acyltransferase (sialic acid O-acetyltransferase NeuD family)